MRYRRCVVSLETRAEPGRSAAIVDVPRGSCDTAARAPSRPARSPPAAGVQAPTIYRLFGDKDGLLDALAEHVFSAYVAGKAPSATTDDPVADLRAGWDTHIGFGLANPELFALLTDPAPRRPLTGHGRRPARSCAPACAGSPPRAASGRRASVPSP